MAPLCGCAQPEKQAVASAPAAAAPPPPPCIVAALRPTSAANDPNGALAQIMSILGQPLAQGSGTEIIIRLPDNSTKSLVQADAGSLSPGVKVFVSKTPTTSIQPY